MILGFTQKFSNGSPTYFKEKILASVGLVAINGDNIKHGAIIADVFSPKIHTIRQGNRWKEGMSIQMATGVRTKNYKQFNKGIPELETVKSVQSIKMYFDFHLGLNLKTWAIYIDDNFYMPVNGAIEKLALNDGFNNVPDFINWFHRKEPFFGQIIHWTNFKY